MATVSIDQLLADDEFQLELELRAGSSGRGRAIGVPRIQKPGLALTGYAEQLHSDRLLALGATEISYLQNVDAATRVRGIATVIDAKPACVVVTRGLQPPQELCSACDAHDVCLLVTKLTSAEFIERVIRFLQEHLSPTAIVHGVLIEVLGVGILLIGKSGVGKSEAALDLLVRGHRLVADDVVTIRRIGKNLLYGAGSGIVRHHMEIRGLGIISIEDLFGISSVRDRKRITLVVELSEWDAEAQYDRLGIDEMTHEILGEEIPLLRIPVRPGRNVATLIEVAARNQLLKFMGHNAAVTLSERLSDALAHARTRALAEPGRDTT